MKYRELGKTGVKVSEIGMGLEHLLDKDERVVIDTIRAAVNSGVTYLDCHPGHDFQVDSVVYEGYEKLSKALRGTRDRLCLTYLAARLVRSPLDMQPRFENYLHTLNTDHTEVFIIQFCDKAADFAQVTGEGGMLEYALKLKAEGKIRAIGISTHSSAIAYKAIDNGAFDVLMYPINPAFDVVTDGVGYDADDLTTLWDAAQDFSAADKKGAQPRKSVYSECRRARIGLVAMKPFAGGFIFRVEKDAGFTPINLISYTLAQSGVSTVIPGCTKPSEIEEILNYYTCADDARDYSEAVAKSRWSVMENCLYCNHCLPCSAGINIGQINRLLDDFTLSPSADEGAVSEKYRAMPVKATSCIQCGICMERCPFKVNVIGRMKRAAEVFGYC